jgi:hypothetical protein
VTRGAERGSAARGPAAGVPRALRASFAFYLGDVALAVLVAVVELVFHLSAWTVLVGAAIEAAVLLGFGSQMLTGKQWGRVGLMSFSWVFLAINALAIIGLNGAFGKGVDELALFALVCVAAKLLLIALGLVSMYRPSTRAYFVR